MTTVKQRYLNHKNNNIFKHIPAEKFVRVLVDIYEDTEFLLGKQTTVKVILKNCLPEESTTTQSAVTQHLQNLRKMFHWMNKKNMKKKRIY